MYVNTFENEQLAEKAEQWLHETIHHTLISTKRFIMNSCSTYAGMYCAYCTWIHYQQHGLSHRTKALNKHDMLKLWKANTQENLQHGLNVHVQQLAWVTLEQGKAHSEHSCHTLCTRRENTGLHLMVYICTVHTKCTTWHRYTSQKANMFFTINATSLCM